MLKPTLNSKSLAWRALSAVGWGLVLIVLTACGGTKQGLFRPNGVAVGADGAFYIMDRGNARVVVARADGRIVRTFGRLGQEKPEDIYYGWDAELDSQGNIYVCNMVRDQNSVTIHDGVKVFSPDGRFLREIGGIDYGKSSGAPHDPYGMDIDARDWVYIAGFSSNALRVFNAQGDLLGNFFGRAFDPVQFQGINDVAVDSRQNRVYLLDQSAGIVQAFSLKVDDGKPQLSYLRTIGEYGRNTGQFAYPHALTVDEARGRLYVSDMGNRRIQAFDAEGQFLFEMRPELAQFAFNDWQATGMGIGADGTLYVADTLNNTLWVFDAEGQTLGQHEVRR